MQASLLPIRIIQQVPSTLQTADLKTIGLGDDGFEYALKRLEDHALLPISEWMGYQLCRAVGLFTPDFAPVWLDDDTPAFGSRWEQAAQIGIPPHPIEVAKYFGGSMRLQNASVFGVDAFLPNEDRHSLNFMWRNTSMGVVPLAFDFSRAWLITGLPFGGHPLHSQSATMKMWSYLKAQFGYQIPSKIFQKISSLPDDWLKQVLDAAPAHWLAGFDPKPTIEFWVHHRQQRCTEAINLL